MRPKVFIIVVALGLFTLGSLFVIRQSNDRYAKTQESPATAPGTNLPRETLASTNLPVVEADVAAQSRIQTATMPSDSSEDAQKAYVEQRSAQLLEMAMTDDRTSLDSILSELANRDPEIRKAALEATIQFGSRDAIPKLADAASQTDDPNEKAALTDAIEFLKLPSLTEISSHSAKPVANNSTAGNKPANKGTWGKRVPPAPSPNQ